VGGKKKITRGTRKKKGKGDGKGYGKSGMRWVLGQLSGQKKRGGDEVGGSFAKNAGELAQVREDLGKCESWGGGKKGKKKRGNSYTRRGGTVTYCYSSKKVLG